MYLDVQDVVWAKLRGYPYWPARIIVEASSGTFKKGSGSSTKIHVEFLGGEWVPKWISLSLVRKFEAEDTGPNRKKDFRASARWEVSHLAAMKIGLDGLLEKGGLNSHNCREVSTMESTIPTLTLKADLVYQQRHLKEVVSLANQQDTDMVIVSKDKQLLPCHRSLLALFSPVVALLLSEVPCCSSPTILLPDFPAIHIRKLLHLLRSGQAIPGENLNVDIRMINRITEVLQISMIELNLGPYLENPLEVSFEIKKEFNSFTVKEEITSFKEEKKDEVLHLKQETESYDEKLESIPVKQEEIAEQYEYIEEDETEEVMKQEYMDDTGSHQEIDDKLLNETQIETTRRDFLSLIREYDSNSVSKAKEARNKPKLVADIKREKPKVDLKPEPNVCQFFVKGKCYRKFCKFLHEKPFPSPTKKEETAPSNSTEKEKQPGIEPPADTDTSSQNKAPAFKTNDPDLVTKTEASLKPPTTTKAVTPKVDTTPKPNVCWFFLQGGCYRRLCKYLHQKPSSIQEKKEEPSSQKKQDQAAPNSEEASSTPAGLFGVGNKFKMATPSNTPLVDKESTVAQASTIETPKLSRKRPLVEDNKTGDEVESQLTKFRTVGQNIGIRSFEQTITSINSEEIILASSKNKAKGRKVCTVCGKSFRNNVTLMDHKRTHDKKFHKSNRLKNNIKSHTEEISFSCMYCPKTFGRYKHLKSHMIIHTEEKTFLCLVCSKRFTTSSTLNIHKKRCFMKL